MIWKFDHEIGTDQTLAGEPRTVTAFYDPHRGVVDGHGLP